jgi:hypothetical protein
LKPGSDQSCQRGGCSQSINLFGVAAQRLDKHDVR